MPRIQTYTSRETVNSGLQQTRATPNDFGAQIGGAVTDLGGAIAGTGATVARVRKSLSDDLAASNVATFDYSKRLLDRQTASPPGAEGFYAATPSDYQAAVDQHVGGIKDPKARKAARDELLSRQPSYMARAAEFETTQAATYSKQLADDGLSAITNRVRTNPDDWVLGVQDADRIIDRQQNIPAVVREDMKQKQREDLTRSRFEALVTDAADVPSLNAVEKDVESGRWDRFFAPTDKDRILDAIKTGRTSLNTKTDSDALAALNSVKDRVEKGVMVDPREMQGVAEAVKASNNPARLWTLTEYQERQRVRGQEARLPPSILNDEIAKGDGQQNIIAPSLPKDLNDAINNAALISRGQIPSSYLVGLVGKEYGGLIAGGDWTKDNIAGASKAKGPAQFIPSTWLDIVSRHPAAFGLTDKDVKDDPDAVLQLRGDVDASMIGAAIYAAENKQKVEAGLGRSIDDAELYMAHFLGAGGATTFLKAMASDPDSSAATLLPQAAAANPDVFYRKGGGERSVREVYGNIASSFMGSPSRVDFVRNDERKNIARDQAAGLADDPMSWAANSGSHSVGGIDTPQDMAARGTTAQSIANYYSIPTEDMKPFTKDEAAALTKKIKEGRSDEVLQVMSQIQGMGPEMARAAYKQLGEKEPVFEYAARLATDGGSGAVAGDIVRGQKRMDDNPDFKTMFGRSQDDINQSFNTAAGVALTGISPRDAQAIRDATLAHYAETFTSRGNQGLWNDAAFSRSVNAVLGAREGQDAVGVVNGAQTLLPDGMTADTVEQTLDGMTAADFISASHDGKPPRYADGTPAEPDDIAAEGKLRAIGRDLYQVQMADGNFLATDVAPGGRVSLYIMELNAEFASKVIAAQPPPKPARIFPGLR